MLTLDLDALDFAKGKGLVTVVVQDVVSGTVLMVAYADREALERSVATGEMHFHSRTRGLWRKGATSGNTQRVLSLAPDCDGDTVLARVIANGPACHTGVTSCFGDSAAPHNALSALDAVIADRATSDAESGDESYTRRLLDDRNLRLKKIGEEAAELVVACADNDRPRCVAEAADLVYHILVALRAVGVGLDDLAAALEQRRGAIRKDGR